MEQLETRDVPTVQFVLMPDQQFLTDFPAEALTTLQAVAKYLGSKLSVDQVIHVTVTAANLLPAALARAGPTFDGGQMLFDPSVNWYFGSSIVGSDPLKVDFFTVAEHEFGHILGVGTRPNWGDGFKVADDLVHLSSDYKAVFSANVAGFGKRTLFTNTDYDLLDNLGWQCVRPAATQFAFVSSLGPDGHCRLYVFSREGVRFIADTGRFHVTFTDLDYDGVIDALITPVTPGFTAGFNRATGEITFAQHQGTYFVVTYF